MSKALVILSGGQDSTTCLFWALKRYDEVVAVTYDYDQRHVIEVEAARHIARMAKVEHIVQKIGPILRGTSPLVSGAPLEQYKDAASLPGGLEKTFVPGRNALFLVLAANLAYTMGIVDLVTGVSMEDYGGYPDCREPFINAMAEALNAGLYEVRSPKSPMLIHTPLMHMSKADTVRLAYTMPDCWTALAFSHTAYDGQYPPTGHDHATLLRAKGFEQAGLPDPLVLRAVQEGKMALPTTSNYTAWE